MQNLTFITAQDQKVNNIINELLLKYKKYIYIEPEYRLIFAMTKILINVTQSNKLFTVSNDSLQLKIDVNIANNIQNNYFDL